MLDLFEKPIGRKMSANKMLASRAQTSTESYIEDVISLCRRVNAEMPEADKGGHILKGVAEDAFSLLICKNHSTVDAIIKECRRALSKLRAGTFLVRRSRENAIISTRFGRPGD